MDKVIVEEEFWELFPEGQVNILVVKNIDNQVYEENQNVFTKLLNESAKEAGKFLEDENFSQNQVVKEWREAFSKFKTKKGARSSIEALLKRVAQDRPFTPINPLVDIYNSISLKYGVPSGGDDIDKIVGDLHLGKALGGEPFLPLGAENDAPALAEEVIYFDEEGAICRSLNWREAQRTMLTEATENAIFVIESINKEQAVRANLAMAELKKLVDDYFKSTSIDYLLTRENPMIMTV